MNSKSSKKSKNVSRKTAKNNITMIIFSIIVLLISFLIFKLLYTIIKDKIVNSTIENMEELSKHDEKNIISSLSYRFDDIDGVVIEIIENKFETIKDMQELLNIKTQAINALDIALVDEEGT